MSVLTLELPPDAYHRLREEAARLGKPPQTVAEEWLVERLTSQETVPDSDREKVRQALYAAGLLTEIGPNLHRLADPMVPLKDVSAALDRSGGKTLSEIVLEQRGSKE